MKIEFHCSECGGYIASDVQFRGEVIRCPNCRREVVVPLTTVGPGVVVAGFRILRKIGVGGMGSVYLAEQTRMGRLVALKVLPPAYTRDSLFLDRFLKEIRLQGSLSHPNIATAYDAGGYGDIFYLAMEYVDGQDLCQMIEQSGRLEERVALRIARQAAAGLAYAWLKQNLIHRDVKPGNIMITPDQEVKILDLGVSKTQARSGETQYPTEESVIGTPHYMSLEQARESASVDLRSDIYSLGATLYHMLTGRMPFPGENLVEVITRQLSGPAPAPRTLNPEISEPCAHLLEVMMAREAEERYPNWEQCIADIDRVLAGNDPLVPRPVRHGSMIASVSADDRRPRASRRTAVPLPLVAGGTLVLAALLVWEVAIRRPRSEPPRRPARPSVEPPTNGTARLPPTAAAAENDAALRETWEQRLIAQRNLRQSAGRSALRELEEAARPLIDRGALLQAAELFRAYSGPGAVPSARRRLARAEALEATARERANAPWQGFHGQVVTAILSGSPLESVLALCARAREEPSLDAVRDQVDLLEQEVVEAARVPGQVMLSFRDDLGQETTVLLTRGPRRLVISEVGPTGVVATQVLPQGTLTYTFGYRDLALQEKIGRLARSGLPAAQFQLGLIALEAGEPAHAMTCFRRADGELSHALADQLAQTTPAAVGANPLE